LEKHGEGTVEKFGGEEFFRTVDGAFTGGFDLVKVSDEAKPLFEWAVGEGDFEVAYGGICFVRAEDADAKGTAGMLDEGGETTLEISWGGGGFTAFLKKFVQDKTIESARVEDLIDTFEFGSIVAVVGGGTEGPFRNWTKWQGMAV